MAGADPEQYAEVRRLRKINSTLGKLHLRTFLTERVERRNLSLSIESEIVQLLIGARLQLSTLIKHGCVTVTGLESIEEHLVAAVEATRRVTEKLSPHVLEVAGLEDALHDLCHKKSRLHHAACHIDAREMDACLTDKTSRIVVYGIICRLLEGFLEFESADTIWIWLHPREDCVHLIMEDNSQDFDIQDITHPDDFPDVSFLIGLHEEIRCLKGTMKVERTSDIRVTTITLPISSGCLEY